MMRARVWFTTACLLLFLISPFPALTSAGSLPASNRASAFRCTDTALSNMLAQVSSSRLMTDLDALTEFNTRYVNSTPASGGGIAAAETYIESKFAEISGLAVSTQDFPLNYHGIQSTATNVIATLPGTDGDAGVLVVGAHYDSISFARQTANDPAPGADDNASGVSALIEMARLLSATPHRATLIFVAFSAEEIGRFGSQAFVNDYLPANQISVQAMINLDIIGSSTGNNGVANDREVRLFSDPSSRQFARTISLIGQSCSSGALVIVQDAEDRPGRYGDHQSFSDAGIAAVRFTEAAEQMQRSDEPDDTAGDIQPAYYRSVVQTVLASLVALADGPQPPQGLTLSSGAASTLSWQPVSGAADYVVALRSPRSLVYDTVLEVNGTAVNWGDLSPVPVAGMAIASVDGNGLIGLLSADYQT